MSITDELREFIETHLYLGATALGGWKEAAFAIADRIDEEHQKAIRELNNLADASVLLPVDADGVPIHIRDKVTEHEDEHTFKVDGFMDWGGEWWVFMRDGIQAPARMCTHYHAPTVGDVLREFAEKVTDSQIPGVHPTYEEAIAEYAKRLRLAGEDA